MKKYLYRIFPDNHLIIKYFSGSCTMEDIKQAAHQTAVDPQYNPSMNVLNDFRQIKIQMNESDVEMLEKYLQQQENLIGIRKSAFLTENPEQTVFSIMLETYKSTNDISLKTFSTLNGALNWLGLQKMRPEIEKCLNEFSQGF